METSKKVYFENLDALRFISFFFIFFGHSINSESLTLKSSSLFQIFYDYSIIAGKTGFSFAFVLSSYINTWVILEEWKLSGKFNPLKYYIRRALRIWPLYFLVLFVGFEVFPLLKDFLNEPYYENANPLYFIFFWGNFYLIEHGFTYLPVISVLWSVSVEEQFYICWPFLLIIFRNRIKWLLAMLYLVFVITVFVRYGHANLFFHTLYLLADLATGASFAFLSFYQNKPFTYLKNISCYSILGVYFLFFFCLIFYHSLFDHAYFMGKYRIITEKITFAFIIGFIIFEQNFCIHSFFKFGRLKGLSFLGSISYSLFCLHEIGILAGNRLLKDWNLNDSFWGLLVVKQLVALIIIVPLAYLSWTYFEMKFMKLKKYFYS